MFETLKTKIDAAKELRSWWRDLPTVTIRGVEAKWVRNDPVGNAAMHQSGLVMAVGGKLPGIGPFIATDEYWEDMSDVTQRFMLCHEFGHLLAGHCERYARQGFAKLLKGMSKEDVAMSNRNIEDEFVADELAAELIGAAGAVVALKEMKAAIAAIQDETLDAAGDILDPVGYAKAYKDAGISTSEITKRIARIEDAMWAGDIQA